MERLETRNVMTGLFCPLLTDATPVGDFNGDGYDDLAGVTAEMEVRVYYGSEDGLTEGDYDVLTTDWLEHGENFAGQTTKVVDAFVRPGYSKYGPAIDVDFIRQIGPSAFMEGDYYSEEIHVTRLSFLWRNWSDPDQIDGELNALGQVDYWNEHVYRGRNDSSDFNGDGVQDLVKTTNFGEVSVVYRRSTERTGRDG